MMSRRLGTLALITSIERRPVSRSKTRKPAQPGLQTRSQEAEQQVLEQRDRALMLVRSAGQFTWVATPRRTLRDPAQWCEFTGQSLDAARGRGWLTAVHPRDRASVLHADRQALVGTECLEVECRIRRRDGVYRNVLMRAVPVMDANGDLREWAGACMDVTERTSLHSRSLRPAEQMRDLASQLATALETATGGQLSHETSADVRLIALLRERAQLTREREQARGDALALAAANQRMDEFLAVAAHDLKSPMTSSKGYVQLATRRLRQLAADLNLRTDRSLIEDIRRSLERADQSLGRLNRLADRLLDFGRIRSGRLHLSPYPADLIAIVREVVEDHQHATPDRAIHLVMPPGQAVPIFADADRIGQVVMNFLTNGLRYSAGDRPVTVTVSRDEEQHVARVSVRDEGRGIPLSKQKMIWRRFEQARLAEEQAERESGLGLGLYIAKSIVEGHRGQIGVESRVGHGATFWFTLPLAVARS
jgi:PAS domain S-box-containing protein